MADERVRKAASALSVLALVLGAYMGWARPAQLRWGATDDETARAMPGDELSDHPTFLSTRAITINATPEAIWPWLVQLGWGRAGFYGYDIVENIGSPRGIHSAERIVPELQHLAVGDPLPLSVAGGLVVNAVTPDRFLVWAGSAGRYPGGFTWALYPMDALHTRLVSRIQWSHHWSQPLALGMDLFTEFADHVAVRKVLHGVKDRAEGRVESFAGQTGEFAVLVWSLLAFGVALGLLLLDAVSWRRWGNGLLAGAVWLVVWYGPLSLWLAVTANVVVLGALVGRRPRVQTLAHR